MKEPWGYVARFANVARAIEVAMAGDHRIRVIGHHDDTRLMKNWVQGLENGIRYASPCPCGNYKSSLRPCGCSIEAINEHAQAEARWEVDMTIECPLDDWSDKILKSAFDEDRYEPFEKVQERINMACAIHGPARFNENGRPLLKAAIDHLHLTLRTAETVLKVADTIARMEYALISPDKRGALTIEVQHVAEALQYCKR